MKVRSLVLIVVVAAVCLAVLAPAAVARDTGVTIKLKGPSSADYGATIKLHATLKDSLMYGGGNRVAVLLQNKDGHLRRIASKEVDWRLGGSLGSVTFSVTATPTAMGLAKYRVAWKNPGGVTRSNVWSVEID